MGRDVTVTACYHSVDVAIECTSIFFAQRAHEYININAILMYYYHCYRGILTSASMRSEYRIPNTKYRTRSIVVFDDGTRGVRRESREVDPAYTFRGPFSCGTRTTRPCPPPLHLLVARQ